MASVSSSSNSFTSMYGITNKGIGGLASGLDTDSLVEALTAGTRSKIAAQSQKKTLLNWKISAYRGMATALRAYQDKYLKTNITSKTVLSSNSFFNTYKATSSSDKISVTASSGSLLGDFSIDRVAQLASSASLTNKTQLSTDLTFGIKVGDNDIDKSLYSKTAFTGKTLQLDLDSSGSPKNIKLDSLNQFIVEDTGTGAFMLDATKTADIETELNRLVTEAFGTKNNYNADGSFKETVSKVKVEITADGTIKFDADASKISVASDCAVAGLTKGTTNRVDMSTKIGAIDAFANLQGEVLSFSINGVEITVSKNDTLSSLKTKIDTSTAGVRFDYNQYTDEFTLTAKSSGSGNTIDIRDTQGNLMNQLFGAESGGGIGTNWLISKETPLGQEVINNYTQEELNTFAKNISNLEFNLTIDGVTKLVKADSTGLNSTRLSEGTTTINDILSAINKGITNAFTGTGVSFSLDSATGKVKMSGYMDDPLGVGFAATASIGGSYNALAVLGVTDPAIGNTVLDMGYNTEITASAPTSVPSNLIGGNTSGTFKLTINGVTQQLEVFGTDVASLNSAIKTAFGSATASQVSFSQDANGNLVLNTKDSNTSVAISNGENIGDNKVDIYEYLGFGTTAVNNVNPSGGTTTFADLKNSYDPGTDNLRLVGGTLTFTLAGGGTANIIYDSTTDLQTFLAEINDALGDPTAASINNGRLSIKSEYMTGVKETNGGNVLETLFGVQNGSFQAEAKAFGTDADGKSKFVEGKDAEIVINGKTLSFASNTFTMNGTTVTVNGVSEIGDKPITVNVTSDPEDVIERLKGWIEDYNGLIATLNNALYEGKVKDYEPLTDEQKAEMTDDQIKTWETEAKKGILRNDQTLAKIISDLRNDMYKKVEAAGISLFDVGITTKTYSYTDITQAGQLEISDETKLRDMLTNDPDKVRLLFTDTGDGLAARMNTIITNATNTSSVSRGSLYRLAGTETTTGDNTSVLGKQIDDIDKYVTTLKARLESEYNRYWKQFSALETAIQRMNAQSSWLAEA